MLTSIAAWVYVLGRRWIYALPVHTKSLGDSIRFRIPSMQLVHFIIYLLMNWPLDSKIRVLIVSKIHLLRSSSLKFLKRKAKELQKDKSISLSQALSEVAIEQGFANWKELLSTCEFEETSKYQISFTDRNGKVIDTYTTEQKIGAIARHRGLNPKNIKNTIHVSIAPSDEVYSIDDSTWEAEGFFHDRVFSDLLEEHDPYFTEYPPDLIFRVISIDSESFPVVQNFMDTAHEKFECFFNFDIPFIWINGRIDPFCLHVDPDYPDDSLPLFELPPEVWKRGY